MREDVIDPIAHSLEFIGVAIVAVGFLLASIGLVRSIFRTLGPGSTIAALFDVGRWETELEPLFALYRNDLLRVVVLGLTFLVAGDIVQTASVDRTLEDVGTLAIVVLIREFLSFALIMETTSRWPWQRARGGPDSGDDAGPSTETGRGGVLERPISSVGAPRRSSLFALALLGVVGLTALRLFGH